MLRFLRRGRKEKTEQATTKTRRAWFGRLRTMFRGARVDDELWDQMEEALISSDVGVQTSMDLIERAKDRVRDQGVADSEGAFDLLKQEMARALESEGTRLMEVEETPTVILMVGVNGAGKTTSIAKLADVYQKAGYSVVLGAADTFRAAAIEQLQEWGRRLDVDVIAHQGGGDPGAVAFDTVQAARARNADVAIIDTAGRLHSKTNLMEELRKVHRVAEQQANGRSLRVLLTLDATTGQNGLIQARSFTELIDCDGVFLAKLDGTSKGGIVVAIAQDLGLPVLYIGTGETLDDIAPFDPREFVDALFGED